MQTPELCFTFALVLSGAAACDDHRTDAAPDHPRSDVAFIDAMVPHHQMAVEMSDMVLERSQDPEIKAMAQAMRAAQTAEIAQMKAIRRELAGSDEIAAVHDEHMHEDMQKMAAASDAALGPLFVEEMLPHHAGAITMAHQALPYLQRADLRAMAETIIRDQAEEIGQLGEMLEP